MNFKTKITKEEINNLPIEVFDGKITLVENAEKVTAAIDELRKHPVVGIDTETRPSFSKGVHYKVALVQISTLDHCYLFRLNKMDYSKEMFDFLADPKIKKIGLSLRDDISGLSKRHLFKPQNFIDIQSIAQSYGILELSLQKIYAIIFDKKISKAQRLTNWESSELTTQQQVYAATDAWACLRIYTHLENEKKLSSQELKDLLKKQEILKNETSEKTEN